MANDRFPVEAGAVKPAEPACIGMYLIAGYSPRRLRIATGLYRPIRGASDMALDVEVPEPPDPTNRGKPAGFEWRDEPLGEEDLYWGDPEDLLEPPYSVKKNSERSRDCCSGGRRRLTMWRS